MYNPHQITREFEAALCKYTGAKYAVAVNSCTMALLLAVSWHVRNAKSTPVYFEIPSHTYVSVPMSIIHGGGKVKFKNYEWFGEYQLGPSMIYDCARRFTSNMYRRSNYQCVSFHTSKILSDTQGGAILHDDDEADSYFRKARFDGRTEGLAPAEDNFTLLGWHCYINPDTAARLLWKLGTLPSHNQSLPNDNYPDLSKFEVFK